MEIFKKIHGYEDLYEISNFGNVKSLRKNKLMSSGWMNRNKEGNAYRFVDLYKKSTKEKKLIHRLVAEHFIENPLNKPCINHIDNNPENNHYSNLEWCTHSENMKHAHKNNRLEHGTINRLSYSKMILKKSDDDIKSKLKERFISSERKNGKKFIEYYCLKCNKINISRADGEAIQKHNGTCNSCSRTK